MNKILIFLLVQCFLNSVNAQWVHIGKVPAVATDIYYHEGDEYITLQQGRLLKNRQTIHTYPTISDNERGLLAVCVWNDKVCVNVTSQDGNKQLVICDQDTILSVDYTNPTSNRHRGGDLVPIGDTLYYSTGYGANFNHAQDLNDLRGKLIRIIDKPNFSVDIIAYGLRNPWRFDVKGDTFYIADVGWNDREEINILIDPNQENLGWPCYEGSLKHLDTCSATTFPTYEYSHDVGESITGGVFVDGYYYFLDFRSGFGAGLSYNGRILLLPQKKDVTALTFNKNSLIAVDYNGNIWALRLNPKTSVKRYAGSYDLLGRQVEPSWNQIEIYFNTKNIELWQLQKD